MWGIFEHYHYLTSVLPSNANCFVGYINKEPVAFVALGVFPHPINKNIVKAQRVVVLPHWQGYGIGVRMLEQLASTLYNDKDILITSTLSAMHDSLNRSQKWLLKGQLVYSNETTTQGEMAGSGHIGVYMETHKFINNGIRKSDFIPGYNVTKEFRDQYPKKTNESKRATFEAKLKEVEIYNKEKSEEVKVEVVSLSDLF